MISPTPRMLAEKNGPVGRIAFKEKRSPVFKGR
jgi:hypothetical protein